MADYKLIKNGVQVNKIVADEGFIEMIRSEYDSIELIVEPEPQPEPEPEPQPEANTSNS